MITDYPSSTLLTTLRRNVARNLSPSSPEDKATLAQRPILHPHADVAVRGHQWGHIPSDDSSSAIDGGVVETLTQESSSDFDLSQPPEAGAVSTRQDEHDEMFINSRKGKYDVIIATDCLWLASQHRNLIRSMLYFLTHHHHHTRQARHTDQAHPVNREHQERSYSQEPPTSHQQLAHLDDGGVHDDDEAEHEDGVKDSGRVWITAGFHTGRYIIASFLDLITITKEADDIEDDQDLHIEGQVDQRKGGAGGGGAEGGGGGGKECKAELQVEFIYERDIMTDQCRPWKRHRSDEGIDERKKWVVVMVLKRVCSD